MYFALVAMTRGDCSLEEVIKILDKRSQTTTRRAGDAK